MIASVDEISNKDVAGLVDFPTCPEQLKQVVELAVNVATDGDGRSDGLYIRLFQKDLFDFLTNQT